MPPPAPRKPHTLPPAKSPPPQRLYRPAPLLRGPWSPDAGVRGCKPPATCAKHRPKLQPPHQPHPQPPMTHCCQTSGGYPPPRPRKPHTLPPAKSPPPQRLHRPAPLLRGPWSPNTGVRGCKPTASRAKHPAKAQPLRQPHLLSPVAHLPPSQRACPPPHPAPRKPPTLPPPKAPPQRLYRPAPLLRGPWSPNAGVRGCKPPASRAKHPAKAQPLRQPHPLPPMTHPCRASGGSPPPHPLKPLALARPKSPTSAAPLPSRTSPAGGAGL